MNTDRLTALAISDAGFIFDPTTGCTYNTNPMGIEIINHLKSGKDISEIMDMIQQDYEVTENELESDVLDFIQSLKNYQVVS